jgi:hypothetical protein
MPNTRVLSLCGDPLPLDPLALAHARMRAAEVEQMRTAVRLIREGADIGVYAAVVRPLLPFVP